MISYGSVCSGIEAASVAWEPLGWRPAWFAEIESFPSSVLAHHWPSVPNLGDFTAIRHQIVAGEVEAPDVLVGGTPCQAFSVAGLRRSLDDERGQLTLQFVGLADAIDAVRSARGLPPVTVVWENVPGVVSTPDNAFGCFLAGLAGEDDPLEPPGGRWTNAGYVRGPRRAVAWRILDAQYFGVAQRRRRVFVVASAGGILPEQILFESDGVRRDFAPSREAGQGFASVAGTLTSNRGGLDRPAGNANELDFCIPVAPALVSSGRGVARPGETRGQYPVVAVMAHGQGNAEIREDSSPTLTCNHEAPIGFVPQAYAIQERAAHPNLNAGPGGKGYQEGVAYTLEARHHVQACAVTGDVFHTLRGEGFDASEDGTGRGMGAVAYGVAESPDLAHCLRSGASKADKHESTTYVQKAMQVRRLTPTECERLQGFPDGHTQIPWRGKPSEDCPDGPRYKALGNSMAVPVMRWIGGRIALQENKTATPEGCV